jgi:hypothetical protein
MERPGNGFMIDMGKRPDGKRDQHCYTFTKLGEAGAARAKMIPDRGVRRPKAGPRHGADVSHLTRWFPTLEAIGT